MTEDLPNHSTEVLLTHLGSSLGGQEIGVEAGEYLPSSLTFPPLALEEEEAGLVSGSWNHRTSVFKHP